MQIHTEFGHLCANSHTPSVLAAYLRPLAVKSGPSLLYLTTLFASSYVIAPGVAGGVDGDAGGGEGAAVPDRPRQGRCRAQEAGARQGGRRRPRRQWQRQRQRQVTSQWLRCSPADLSVRQVARLVHDLGALLLACSSQLQPFARLHYRSFRAPLCMPHTPHGCPLLLSGRATQQRGQRGRRGGG